MQGLLILSYIFWEKTDLNKPFSPLAIGLLSFFPFVALI